MAFVQLSKMDQVEIGKKFNMKHGLILGTFLTLIQIHNCNKFLNCLHERTACQHPDPF